MAGIAAGTDGSDIHSGAMHVLKRVGRELRGDPAALKIGIHTDDVDHPHTLVEGVQSDCHEPNGPSLRDRDEGISLIACTTVPHLLRLGGPPIADEHGLLKELTTGPAREVHQFLGGMLATLELVDGGRG